MPCHAWHEGKKQHNFDLSCFLSARAPNTFADWEIVALFYSALNYVDSYLSRAQNIDLVYSHQDRKNLIRSFLPRMERDYRLLYHIGRDARYNDVPIQQRELNGANSYHSNIKLYLTPVTCSTCGHENLTNDGSCENCGSTL